MDDSREICFILDDEDLTGENISITAKIIEHNPDKIYLIAPNCNAKIVMLLTI